MNHTPSPYDQVLTIYGRKAVQEALQDTSLDIHKLHLADSNKPAAILKDCVKLAQKRGVDVEYHGKRELSFISKNAKQDQGVALDIKSKRLKSIKQLDPSQAPRLLLLDNITNPQNIGMIIRSTAAGTIDGLVIPEKGCAALGPLVIKASTGAIFKAPIYRAKSTQEALDTISADYEIASLDLNAKENFFEWQPKGPCCYVLGNETNGVSDAVKKATTQSLIIPMNNEIESLNVAVTAALIAFKPS